MNEQKKLGYFLIFFSIALIIVLVFVKADNDRQGVFLCEAVAANPSLTMADCPAHNSPISWLLFAAFGISFLVMAAGFYLAFLPGKNVKSGGSSNTVAREISVDTSKLDDDEKRVYEFLKDKEGSAYQSDMIKELDLSKVKATRIIDKLESKGVVERKRRGMTNIVVIK